MPQAAPYIAWAVFALMSAAASYGIARTRQRKIEAGSVSNGHLIMRRDHQARVPRVYGRCRVGVNNVYAHTTGSGNSYLHMICTISEGPIHGIVRKDGTTYTTTASAMPTSNPPLVYLDGELWTKFPAGNIRIEFFDGSDTQTVCSTLQSAHSKHTDTYRNTAYIYIRLGYDRDRFMSDPGSVTVVVDGIECYDPTTASTAWTDNPAVVAYNYMTTSSFRGGMGIPTGSIDITSLLDFKLYCSAKDWTANVPIMEEKPDADNLQRILDGGRGRIINPGGEFKFRFFDLNYESTVMNLVDADIGIDNDGGETIEFAQPDIMDRPNTVRAKYLNGADNKYIIDDYVLADEDAISDDGGDRREITVDVHGLSDINLVQQMANYHLERARYNRTLQGTFGRRCIGLEPMDLVTLTFAPFGFEQKYFRVMSVSPNPDYTVNMSLIEEATALYDDVYDPAQIDWFDTTLPAPGDAVWSVINATISEETYTTRNLTRSRIVVDFDPPAVTDYPFWSYAEIWVRRGESGTWEFRTKAGSNDSNSNFTLDDAQQDELYFVKMVSVSIHGNKEDFDTALTLQQYVSGYGGTPANISALTAIATGSTVTLSATWSGDSDVQAFEIRQGTSWNDGIVVMTAPAHNNDLRCSIHGVRPGTLTFWAAALDTAGNYSSTPVSASVVVFIPAGYTELATYGSWTYQNTNGTFANMDQATHTFGGTSYDALKVDQHYWHPFELDFRLYGTWQSRTHDLGAVEKVRIWGDFVTDLDDGGNDWEDHFLANTDWEGLGLSGTWEQNFSRGQGGKLQAKLLVKDTDSDWDNPDAEYDFFEFQAVEVECRYVRVEVIITDPDLESFLYMKELDMYAYEGPA